MKALRLSVAFLFAAAAPTTTVTAASPTIQVGGNTFLAGAAIPVAYQLHGSASGVGEFIGIFPSSVSPQKLQSEGLLWKWLCDRQGTNCPSSTISSKGNVQFSGISAAWHHSSDWPLIAGTYRAYLLTNDMTATFWPVLAQSDTFTVTAGSTSGNAQALTHLADARSAIEDLIRNDQTLAPKFLRMGFHDCIGGCDGALPYHPNTSRVFTSVL
jgi:hypothetical protein